MWTNGKGAPGRRNKSTVQAMKRAMSEERQLMLSRIHEKEKIKKRVSLKRKGFMSYKMGSGLKDF